ELKKSIGSVLSERLVPILNSIVVALPPPTAPPLAPTSRHRPSRSSSASAVVVARGPAWICDPMLGKSDGAISYPMGSGPRLNPPPAMIIGTAEPGFSIFETLILPAATPYSPALKDTVAVPAIFQYVGRGAILENN